MGQLFDLSGKVAIVTGASRGLGKAIALGLAEAGADIVASSRTLSECQQTADQIAALGPRSLAVACDIGNWQAIDNLVEKAHAHMGRIDILVNNAGIAQDPHPLTDTSEEMFNRYYQVNTKGPMHLAAITAPIMAQTGGGSIVNIITMGALKPGGYLPMYCSSKAALKALTRCMAEEWASLGVRANAIAPGPFLTDMLQDLESTTPGFIEGSANITLLKRIAQPEEIVGPVTFMASDASSYVTGQCLSVCGGAIC
ncbi:MAG: SDR family oxidoreductase [Halieaceae bacterium]|jgi:NAD(P)-dependent dehydrogenase (short-subunit alcohol dehydrogenase family)|nr:SDR family oxidoreductase [Halieaceae bacterium]